MIENCCPFVIVKDRSFWVICVLHNNNLFISHLILIDYGSQNS